MKLNHLQIMDTIDKNYEVVIPEPSVKRTKPKPYKLVANFPVGELTYEQVKARILNPNKRIKGPIAPWHSKLSEKS